MDAADEHKTVYYRIEGGNEEKQFAIGELNGSVYLNWTAAGLDREKVPVYSLTIAAISRVNNTEQKSTVIVRTEIFISLFLVFHYEQAIYWIRWQMLIGKLKNTQLVLLIMMIMSYSLLKYCYIKN